MIVYLTAVTKSLKVKNEFTADEARLRNCIQNHYLFQSLTSIPAIFVDIPTFVANKLAGVILTSQELRLAVGRCITYLQEDQGDLNSYNDVFWLSMEQILLRALEDCSEEDVNEINSQLEIQFFSRPVPRFYGEDPLFAAILDYILVDWVIPPGQMIRTRDGRSQLRRYAEDAQRFLYYALSRQRNNDFQSIRLGLRITWSDRADRYFDGRNSIFPYIIHDYNAMTSDITTFSNLNYFYLRRNQNAKLRNPAL